MSPRRRVGAGVLALLLLSAGLTHFLNPSFFISIVPPFIPWPRLAVGLSGAAELVLGVSLLIPRISRLAAAGAALLFVAVFPANIYHWLGHVQAGGMVAPGWYHTVRLPLQPLLVAWAWWLSRAPAEKP